MGLPKKKDEELYGRTKESPAHRTGFRRLRQALKIRIKFSNVFQGSRDREIKGSREQKLWRKRDRESQRSKEFLLPWIPRPLGHLITALLPGNMRSDALKRPHYNEMTRRKP